MIFWSVTFVVTIKYLFFLTRADNRGEGGIMAAPSEAETLGELTEGEYGGRLTKAA